MDQGISSDSDLGINVTVLVIGPSGGGKTSIIRNLLYPGFGVKDSFAPGPTNKIAVYSGDVMGVHFTFIDTPGVCKSSEYRCLLLPWRLAVLMYYFIPIFCHFFPLDFDRKPGWVPRFCLVRLHLIMLNTYQPAYALLSFNCRPELVIDINAQKYGDFTAHKGSNQSKKARCRDICRSDGRFQERTNRCPTLTSC